ncbi:MAG: FHA domain-containing protein [Planctomycetes bacterium]|nr:FHA domain-containing protein [Planctomycetota bacterium]
MASDLVLVIEGGERDGERFALRSNRLTIGRAPGSDLLLKDGSVSSKHALLKLEGIVLEVEDLGSTNGTFVDGERVEHARVEIGGSFQIGKIRLRLDRAGDAGKTGVGIARPEPAARASESAAAVASSPSPSAAPGPARASSTRAASADDEGASSGRSEELKALAIGGAGAALVLALGFFVLRGESPAARLVGETDDAPLPSRISLGSDAGFELEERDPAVSWETIAGSSGEATRTTSGAAEGQRCLKVALSSALGERYVPSVGVALAQNRIPSLAAGEALDFTVLARADAEAGAAFAARYQVDDDPTSPATVTRGALFADAPAAEEAPGWKKLALRVAQLDEAAGEANFDLGLLAWSARGGNVHFDGATVALPPPGSAAPTQGIAQPERVELDGDGRFHFVWSGLGSALVGRWSHRGESRRLALVRDLVFVPLESARPLWMDPNFAPLLAAGASGTRRIPASYLRDGSGPIDLRWSWTKAPRGSRHVVVLKLGRAGAGPLPPVSFVLPGVLLGGSEDEATARFGGDELVANWILDEDAAARRSGDAYPAVGASDEVLDGVVGLGFGSFELRSALRLDRPVRAETRRVRGGVLVSLWAELGAEENLSVTLGPIDAPSDLEVETAKRTAQGHASAGRIGAAVATLRGVLDRAVLVPNANAKRARTNVEVVVRNQYGPLVKQLGESMASAVQRFDAVRRRAEQALAVGSPDELRALLTQIEETQGLAEIYQATSYGPEIDRLRANLRAGLEAAAVSDPRRAALLQLADDLSQRRAASGDASPSPLAEHLRSRAQ